MPDLGRRITDLVPGPRTGTDHPGTPTGSTPSAWTPWPRGRTWRPGRRSQSDATP